MFEDLLMKIAATGTASDPAKDGDYINENGLLTCGKCHTPKRSRISLPNDKTMIVVAQCKCQADADRREKAEKQRIELFDKVAALKQASIVDGKFRDAKFASSTILPDNERQIKICRNYVEKFPEMLQRNQGLLLYGNVGTGKSHIAACVCNALMDGLIPVYATSFVKLLENGPKGIDVPGIIALMEKADLVLFDDIGAERDNTYSNEVVYDIIDSRYRQRKPMIVTTNISLMEMQQVTDRGRRRIYDRIMECCYPVAFNGKSFRLKEARRRYDDMEALLGV